jgi:hypothetical protein
LVFHIKGKTQIEGFERKSGVENIGSKRGEPMGGWRKLRNENFHNFNFSSGIISVNKSRMMRMPEYAASMGEKCIQNIGRKPEDAYHSEDVDVMRG